MLDNDYYSVRNMITSQAVDKFKLGATIRMVEKGIDEAVIKYVLELEE